MKELRPPLTTLRPYLPPPKDLTRLSDGDLARFLAAMGHRFNDGCSDHVWRLLLEAAARLRMSPQCAIKDGRGGVEPQPAQPSE